MAAADSVRTWLDERRVDPGLLRPDEVVGIGHVLAELRSISGRLRHPETVVAAGGELPRGVLLHGPAGSGKTTSARWLARRIGDVPCYELAPDELTPARIRSVFRALAGVRCVLYVDEIDAIGMHRMFEPDGRRAGALMRALLSCLDGLASAPGPLVVAATTRPPGVLDQALIRPGRIGIHVALGLPDADERLALLEVFCRGRALEPDVDLAAIATAAAGESPAALRQLLDDALGLALADDRTALRQADLEAARARGGHIESPEPEEPVWDRARFATHEAGHVATAVWLRGPAYVTECRIDRWGGATTTRGDGLDVGLLADDEARDQVAMAYGGQVAEKALLGSGSLGARDDVQLATSLLVRRVAAALDDAVPPLALDELGPIARVDELRRLHAHALIREADRAMAVAEAAVGANADAIARFAALLVETRTLKGDSLAAAIAAAGFRTAADASPDADVAAA